MTKETENKSPTTKSDKKDETAEKKTAVKKDTAAKKATAAKKDAAAKKTTAAKKDAAAKKTTAAKKDTAAKKAAAEKKDTAAKKTAAEKKDAVAKKSAADKSTGKKKTPAKKPQTQKAPEPLQDDKIPLDPALSIDPEQLSEELEGLKDLVQDEIDKLMSENPEADWKDLVKSAKEEKLAARRKKPAPICDCCGERPANEDGIYCDECLETMRHYPIEWWKAVIPVLTVVLVVIACSFFAISWPVFHQTANAQQLVKEKKLMSALEAYDNINAEIKVTDQNFGYKYLRNQVEIYHTIGIDTYETLSDFIDSYYAGTAIDKFYNRYAKEVKAEITAYTKVYEYFSTAASGATDYASFLEAYEAETEGKDLHPAMVQYYKYYASLVFGEDVSVQKENVAAIENAAPKMKSLYLPLYAEVALGEQDYDTVLKYASSLAEENAENIYVYLYRSVAYRLKGNINLAANACNEGLEIAPTDPLINYQMSIINLLQGKTQTAKTYAGTAYEYANTENAYISSCSLYALCAQLTNDTETYNAVLEEMQSYGYSLSPDVQKVADGTKTVEDIFNSEKGDFEWT